MFLSHLAVVFDQFIEARCWVKNEYVVGAALKGNAPMTITNYIGLKNHSTATVSETWPCNNFLCCCWIKNLRTLPFPSPMAHVTIQTDTQIIQIMSNSVYILWWKLYDGQWVEHIKYHIYCITVLSINHAPSLTTNICYQMSLIFPMIQNTKRGR